MAEQTPENAWLKRWLIIVLTIMVLLALWYSFVVWLMAFLAATFAVFLDWLARLLRKWVPIRQGYALIAVVVLLMLAMTGVAAWIGPAIVQQTAELSQKVPEALNSAQSWLEQREWGKTIIEKSQKWAESTSGSAAVSRVTQVAASTISGLTGIIVVIAMTLFMAASPRIYKEGFIWLLPRNREDTGRKLFDQIAIALRWWMLGRLASMTVVGVFTGLGLWIVGVPLAWMLGLLAGLLSFVPNIGPVVAAAPGLLLAWAESPQMMLWALAVYIGVQLIESNLITPMIQQYAVSVPPALLLSVQLTMGLIFGIWGMIVATPIMVTVIVIIQMLYIRGQLDKPVPLFGQNHD